MPTTTIEVPVSTIPLLHHALERERAILEISIENTEKKLQSFENRYKMSSKEFIVKFNQGEMGDDQDIMLWAAEYEALTHIKEQLDELSGLLSTWET